MPVCFMGHRFQIHRLSLQQPPLYNMFRPSARKRLLTASKFPAFLNHIDGGLDCHLFFYFHRLIYVARQSQKLGADAVQSRCVCVCVPQASLLISPPESGTLSSNPEVTQTAIHPQMKHRQQFGQLAVYQANSVSSDDSRPHLRERGRRGVIIQLE